MAGSGDALSSNKTGRSVAVGRLCAQDAIVSVHPAGSGRPLIVSSKADVSSRAVAANPGRANKDGSTVHNCRAPGTDRANAASFHSADGMLVPATRMRNEGRPAASSASRSGSTRRQGAWTARGSLPRTRSTPHEVSVTRTVPLVRRRAVQTPSQASGPLRRASARWAGEVRGQAPDRAHGKERCRASRAVGATSTTVAARTGVRGPGTRRRDRPRGLSFAGRDNDTRSS